MGVTSPTVLPETVGTQEGQGGCEFRKQKHDKGEFRCG